MTVKITPRISGERTDLCKAIPLDTPLHMFIDPSAACNHSCKMCFNADKNKTHHDIMRMDTFLKIVLDLGDFPRKLKTVKLYAFGEPLMNTYFPLMVEAMKQAGVSEKVETTTNGWWLTPSTSDRIIAAGLDRIVISVNGLSDWQYVNNTRALVRFDEYVDNIRYFYEHREKCTVHIKTTNTVIGGDSKLFYETFGDIADEIAVETTVPIWNNVALNVNPTTNLFGNAIKPVRVCPYIFYQMTVHATGQVSTCFVDWDRKNIIGDVRKESLVDIWNGQRLKTVREAHLQMHRDRCKLCKDCGQLVYGQADSIDDCAQKIYRRMYE
jgi:radical SAM protein with 4Fe4S-binding SPASM domain